jgi:hypothetical protein
MMKLSLALILILVGSFITIGQTSQTINPVSERIRKKTLIDIDNVSASRFERPVFALDTSQKYSVVISMFPQLETISEADPKYREVKEAKNFFKEQAKDLPDVNERRTSLNISRLSELMVKDHDNGTSGAKIPLDNTIAVDNEGRWLEATNNMIKLYAPDHPPIRFTLKDFFNIYENPCDPREVCDPCDPKVLYDAGQDRFIVYVQENSSTEKVSNPRICMAVMSIAGDPYSNWNFYTIPGTPGRQFDYPKIGITNTEILVSGSLYKDTGHAFSSRIYQFDKMSLYAGVESKVRPWDFRLAHRGYSMPIQSFESVDGFEKAYILATEWIAGSEYCWLLSIDRPGKDPDTKMLSYRFKRGEEMRFFRYGEQKGNDRIKNMDFRMMDGYLKDGKITYVLTNGDDNFHSRIDLNVLSIENGANDALVLKNKNLLLGKEPQTSYCFPSVSWLNNEAGVEELIVQYGGVEKLGFPKTYVAVCDAELNGYSEYVLATSDGPIWTGSNKKIHRWGDYTTIGRHPNGESLVLASSVVRKSQNGRLSLRRALSEISFKDDWFTNNLKGNKEFHYQFDPDEYLKRKETLIGISLNGEDSLSQHISVDNKDDGEHYLTFSLDEEIRIDFITLEIAGKFLKIRNQDIKLEAE